MLFDMKLFDQHVDHFYKPRSSSSGSRGDRSDGVEGGIDVGKVQITGVVCDFHKRGGWESGGEFNHNTGPDHEARIGKGISGTLECTGVKYGPNAFGVICVECNDCGGRNCCQIVLGGGIDAGFGKSRGPKTVSQVMGSGGIGGGILSEENYDGKVDHGEEHGQEWKVESEQGLVVEHVISQRETCQSIAFTAEGEGISHWDSISGIGTSHSRTVSSKLLLAGAKIYLNDLVVGANDFNISRLDKIHCVDSKGGNGVSSSPMFNATHIGRMMEKNSLDEIVRGDDVVDVIAAKDCGEHIKACRNDDMKRGSVDYEGRCIQGGLSYTPNAIKEKNYLDALFNVAVWKIDGGRVDSWDGVGGGIDIRNMYNSSLLKHVQSVWSNNNTWEGGAKLNHVGERRDLLWGNGDGNDVDNVNFATPGRYGWEKTSLGRLNSDMYVNHPSPGSGSTPPYTHSCRYKRIFKIVSRTVMAGFLLIGNFGCAYGQTFHLRKDQTEANGHIARSNQSQRGLSTLRW